MKYMHYFNYNFVKQIKKNLFIRDSISTIFFVILIANLIFIVIIRYSPPLIENEKIIEIKSSNNNFSSQQIFMIPFIHISLVYLTYSYKYIKNTSCRMINNIFTHIELLDILKDEKKETYKSLLNSKTSTYFSLLFIIIVFSIELLGKYSNGQIIYIDWIYTSYSYSLYSLLIYLIGKCIWIFCTTYYIISKILEMAFIKTFNNLNEWIRNDLLGGIKLLSNVSVKLIKLYIFGVFLFIPAPFLYPYTYYIYYSTSIILFGSIIFLHLQYRLHRKIGKEKIKYFNIIDSNFTNDTRILSIFVINNIPEWAVEFDIIIGLFLSNFLLPFINQYLVPFARSRLIMSW